MLDFYKPSFLLFKKINEICTIINIKGYIVKNIKKAFTMIELVFVIVVLGILSAVAIPKLSSSINDANDATAIATVSTIRSAIASERQSNLIKGISSYPELLDDASTASGQELFDGNRLANNDINISILQYPIKSGTAAGDWIKTTANNYPHPIKYKYYMTNTKTVVFTYYPVKATVSSVVYQAGTFDCDHSTTNCKDLLD